MPVVQELIDKAREGNFPSVAVIVGTETFLIERAIHLLRTLTVGDMRGFNDDIFHGKNLTASTIISTANTLPMMADARFVLVRDVDKMDNEEKKALASFLKEPSPSSCVVLTASKLHGSGKLSKTAKKLRLLYDAKPIPNRSLKPFAIAEAKSRGHVLASDAADALVHAIGEDLAALDDAVERLSLFSGNGQRIDISAVETCITRVRTESIWRLVDSVALRDGSLALMAASSLLADREPPLRILAMLARQLRMVGKMRQALADGMSGRDAALASGAPPFKAQDLTKAARRYNLNELSRAFAVIAEADLALKGSKCPPQQILEGAILKLCA